MRTLIKPQTVKGPRHPNLNFSGSSSNAFAAPPTFTGKIIMQRTTNYFLINKLKSLGIGASATCLCCFGSV